MKNYGILIADDEKVVLEHLETFLLNNYKMVFVANNGDEAYNKFREHRDSIDLVVTDICMPILNGIELAKKIKQHTSDVPIIALTASDSDEYILDAFKVGFDGYIIKPAKYEELLSTIDKLIDRKSMFRKLMQYEKIVSSTQDMLAFIDKYRIYKTVNLAYTLSHKRDFSEIVDRSVEEIHGSETYYEKIKLNLDRAFGGEIVRFFDWFGYKAGERYVQVTYIPYWSIEEPKHIEGVVVNVHDLTDWKKSQEKLEDLKKSLEIDVQKKVDELRSKDNIMLQQGKFIAVGEMLSMIAHQWRQPINAISAASIALNMSSEFGTLSPDKIKEQSAFIENICQRMSETINDFMEFFKPNQEKKEFSLDKAFLQVEDIILPQLKNRNITYTREIKENIVLYGVKSDIEHLLLNIIANARDAIEANSSDEKFIKVFCSGDDEFVNIEIEDSGGGVKVEPIEKIFDPYFSTKESGKGTGIGLYMAKTILEKHFNGTIKVSNSKYGASFKIVLYKKAH